MPYLFGQMLNIHVHDKNLQPCESETIDKSRHRKFVAITKLLLVTVHWTGYSFLRGSLFMALHHQVEVLKKGKIRRRVVYPY